MDDDARRAILASLADDTETAGLLQPALPWVDGVAPDEGQVLAWLGELEAEGLVRRRTQDVDERAAGWDAIPEIARGDRHVTWWALTERGWAAAVD
jgi:hypothetical protein